MYKTVICDGYSGKIRSGVMKWGLGMTRAVRWGFDDAVPCASLETLNLSLWFGSQ